MTSQFSCVIKRTTDNQVVSIVTVSVITFGDFRVFGKKYILHYPFCAFFRVVYSHDGLVTREK